MLQVALLVDYYGAVLPLSGIVLASSAPSIRSRQGKKKYSLVPKVLALLRQKLLLQAMLTSTNVLALMVQNYLLYWYKSTHYAVFYRFVASNARVFCARSLFQ
jgi:hypothetical protein